MRQREDRVGRARRHEGKLYVILDPGGGREEGPRVEVEADGLWHVPGSYGDPNERYQRLDAVRATVEYDDRARYRIAVLGFDACPKCGKPALGMREWKDGQQRHVHRAVDVTIRTPDGPLYVAAVYCETCREELATEERRREHLLRG